MEEKKIKFYKVENNELLEINKKTINDIDYVLLLQNNAPNSFYVGKITKDDVIELMVNNGFSTKILVDFLKDKTTHENLQYLADQMK